MYKPWPLPLVQKKLESVKSSEMNQKKGEKNSLLRGKNALSFIMQNLPEKVWFRGHDFCAVIYVR